METAIRWSPHSSPDQSQFVLLDILDNSLTLNQVIKSEKHDVQHEQIASYSKLQSFAAFDWSRTSSQIISLGHISGSASLIRLSPGAQTSQIVATYRVKQQRRCNSIAFNINNWLAVALDKTRSDLCLNIYDAASTSLDPVRRLCPAELVNSVRFFTQQHHEVIIGAQRSFIRLYDLRDGFNAPAGNLQVATRNVNNITIDPLDENYFASGGITDDPSVTIWDKRKLYSSITGEPAAVLDLKLGNSPRTTIWSLRYSGQQPGRLAICTSTGGLKVIDAKQSQINKSKYDHIVQNPHGGQPWLSNHYVSASQDLEHASNDQRRRRPDKERLVAFDWIVDQSSSLKQNLFGLYADGKINMLTMHSKPAIEISSKHEISIASGAVRTLQPSVQDVKAACHRPLETDVPEAFGAMQHSGELSKDSDSAGELQDKPQVISTMLASGMVQRERCRLGYLFDCAKNQSIVKGHWQLERLWEYLDCLKEMAADDGMLYDSVDLSYIGLSGLWTDTIGSSPQRHLSPAPMKIAEAIQGLNDTRKIPPFEGERTDFPEHRQLCLAVCGWKFTTDHLEIECQELSDRGLHYQAIVQAVLHGARHLALNMLRTLIREKTIPNIGLGALLAADDLNNEQREMTHWMAADTDDPALKALLTYLSTGDWRDVMKTNYIHLGYRLALGLKYLNDTELSGFIQAETARAIKNGDLEGVLLTGLTESSMDLFQTYIQRTNDIQTAVLATAFTNPLYVEDARFEMWKETYFTQMQAWRAFPERTRFVVAHNKLARTREGRCLIQPPEAQLKLLCVHCRNELGRPADLQTRPKITGPAANAGIVCLKCGRHLPRCSICTLYLGTPDPRKAKPLPGSTSSVDVMERLIVFCNRCQHGAHAHHAREWFAKYNICPSPGCACACKDKSITRPWDFSDVFNDGYYHRVDNA